MEKEEKKPKEVRKVKKVKRIPTREHTLIKDVIIGDVLHYKDQKVSLTEKGRVYFKQQLKAIK